jgi:tetratricopeptide (TPR) repeat protein
LHIEQKDYLEAFDKLVFAYRVYQKENYNYLQAFILMDMAEIYDRLSNYKIALRYYQRAYEMILTNENTEEKIKNRHIPLLEQKINQLKSHLPDYKQQNLFQAPTLN